MRVIFVVVSFLFALLMLDHVSSGVAFIGTRTHCDLHVASTRELPKDHWHSIVWDEPCWSLPEIGATDAQSEQCGSGWADVDCPRHFAIVRYPYQPYDDDNNWIGWMGG